MTHTFTPHSVAKTELDKEGIGIIRTHAVLWRKSYYCIQGKYKPKVNER
jgi:hypothetical protein